MDDRRFVIVGANAGIGAQLAARLRAATDEMFQDILVGHSKDTRISFVLHMPEIVFEGNLSPEFCPPPMPPILVPKPFYGAEGHLLGRPYVPIVEESHYWPTPARRSRKHWHDLRTFLQREVKADRRREIQAAQHQARLIRRRSSK